MSPSAFSVYLTDALLEMTPSGLSRGPRFGIPQYRMRAYFEPLCFIWPIYLGEFDGWVLQDADTDVTSEVFISI
jgi:hypothetical protein